ncbi:MAG: DUF2809 domain-containing protein [Flavobacterium sp.]|nr:DUF2809 domain-containing protein [Flavobacterium sp.]
MFKFNLKYFVFFILLFITEVIIALYINDNFFRPFFGDFLVVLMIYCFLMSFLYISKMKIALCVLTFSFLIEISQYFNLVALLGLEKNTIARVVMGNSFSFADLICYTLGIVFTISLENVKFK